MAGMWGRYLKRAAAFGAILWGSKTLLFFVGVGLDPIPPFDCLAHAPVYFYGINRMAYVGSVLIASLCLAWWQSVDPVFHP